MFGFDFLEISDSTIANESVSGTSFFIVRPLTNEGIIDLGKPLNWCSEKSKTEVHSRLCDINCRFTLKDHPQEYMMTYLMMPSLEPVKTVSSSSFKSVSTDCGWPVYYKGSERQKSTLQSPRERPIHHHQGIYWSSTEKRGENIRHLPKPVNRQK